MARTPGSEKSPTQPMVVASFWRGWVSLVRPAARKARASRIWRTLDLAERALAMPDPWEGFCFYLE
jgi:hypothetical protein